MAFSQITFENFFASLARNCLAFKKSAAKPGLDFIFKVLESTLMAK